MDDERRRALVGSVRADRRRVWLQVIGGTVAIMVAIPIMVALGISTQWLVVVVAVGVGALNSGSRRSRAGPVRSSAPSTAPSSAPSSDVSDGVRLTNFAFSQRQPTWRGWRHDVCDVVVRRDRLVFDGIRHRLEVTPPFWAEMHHHKYSYWPMVKVSGTSDSGRPLTVYLVGMGRPRSKFSASQEEVGRVGARLVYEVQQAG